MNKYLKKLSNDEFLVLPTDELEEFIKTKDHHIELESDLIINNSQRIFFQNKGRFFSVVTYLPENLVVTLLSSYSDYIVNYIYIVHDSDYDADNKLKKLHIHILLKLSNSYTLGFLVRLFRTRQVQVLESSNNLLMKNKVLYLTHESSQAIFEKKHRYNFNDVKSNNLDFWNYYKNLDVDEMNKAYSIIFDMIAGFNHIDLVKKYGRDFVVNYSKYVDMYNIIKGELENGASL